MVDVLHLKLAYFPLYKNFLRSINSNLAVLQKKKIGNLPKKPFLFFFFLKKRREIPQICKFRFL